MKKQSPVKRVNIVSLKLIKEGSVLYDVRHLTTPADAAGLGRLFLSDLDREQVLVCCLDNKNQPVSINVVSIGTINCSEVHPREVFKTAVLSSAASIILFHNHPSGDPEPSQEDLAVSKRIKDAGELLGIELLDHIIIGSEDSYCSLKERGSL
ncbi:MAG: repair protein RadC [Eubacteriaceae bacterium]|nr:repair protein RadC [Eubacteriaceae bacterium]MDK2961223.1 repair protein RadC [Eubacteriaceae bacterium]